MDAKRRGISGLRLAMKVVQASQPTLRGASEVFPTGFPSVRAKCLHGHGKCALSSIFRQLSLHLLSSQSSYGNALRAQIVYIYICNPGFTTWRLLSQQEILRTCVIG